jgi:hypothetical protein
MANTEELTLLFYTIKLGGGSSVVKIDRSDRIAGLREAIKARRKAFHSLDNDDLILYKVDLADDPESLAINAPLSLNVKLGQNSLLVSDFFGCSSPVGRVNIVVVLPDEFQGA